MIGIINDEMKIGHSGGLLLAQVAGSFGLFVGFRVTLFAETGPEDHLVLHHQLRTFLQITGAAVFSYWK